MRPCPRTLDKPILLLGLEIEDMALIFTLCGAGGLLFGPVIPGIMAAVGWIALVRFKKDKPEGYLIHALYAWGLEMPGLIPPLKRVTRYGT